MILPAPNRTSIPAKDNRIESQVNACIMKCQAVDADQTLVNQASQHILVWMGKQSELLTETKQPKTHKTHTQESV